MYEYLSELVQCVLHCDTHSGIFIQKVDEPAKYEKRWVSDSPNGRVGDFGPNSWLKNLYREAPKTISFVVCPSTGNNISKCKVKSINLNYKNSNVVNLSTMWDMILKDTIPVNVRNPKIKSNMVVSYRNMKQSSTRFSLRCSGLWTTFTPYNRARLD